jgi:electron transport complex protein RnfB
MTGPVSPEAIDALLPQTQCTRCGYSGCKPYAEAIAVGEAAINQCPPGADIVIDRLAALLGQPAQPLNPTHGVAGPPRVAIIDEARCIGCTLCIKACPVDAIVGSAKRMHTVIAAECTGCELCIAPCPVDCISLRPASVPPESLRPDGTLTAAALDARAALARRRYEARSTRAERISALRASRAEAKRAELIKKTAAQTIAEAIARAKAKRAQTGQSWDA